MSDWSCTWFSCLLIEKARDYVSSSYIELMSLLYLSRTLLTSYVATSWASQCICSICLLQVVTLFSGIEESCSVTLFQKAIASNISTASQNLRSKSYSRLFSQIGKLNTESSLRICASITNFIYNYVAPYHATFDVYLNWCMSDLLATNLNARIISPLKTCNAVGCKIFKDEDETWINKLYHRGPVQDHQVGLPEINTMARYWIILLRMKKKLKLPPLSACFFTRVKGVDGWMIKCIWFFFFADSWDQGLCIISSSMQLKRRLIIYYDNRNIKGLDIQSILWIYS